MIQITERFETCRLIAYNHFYNILKFSIPNLRNEVIMTSSLCFMIPPQNLSQKTYRTETLQADSLLQNMQIWMPCDKKWRHNDVITKNNEKMWTSEKQVKLYIIRKVLTRSIDKCKFDKIWIILSKVMGISVKFWRFYHKHSPNMVKLRDSWC